MIDDEDQIHLAFRSPDHFDTFQTARHNRPDILGLTDIVQEDGQQVGWQTGAQIVCRTDRKSVV